MAGSRNRYVANDTKMTGMNWTFLRGTKPAVLATLLLLAGGTWWLTGLWQDHEARSELRRVSLDADQRLTGFASDFERSLAHIRSVPLIIANEHVVGATVTAPAIDSAESQCLSAILSPGSRTSTWPS